MFREQVVEAILAAVQRMYFPVEEDVPTGSIDVRQLRLALAEPDRLTSRCRPSRSIGWTGCAGRTGRSSVSGLIEPSSFSSAYSTSDFHDSAVRSSRRSRG